jgi:hypothetical protein
MDIEDLVMGNEELTACALDSTQLEQLKMFIEEATFELELQDDDLVLTVGYQPEELEGTTRSFGEAFASVGLRAVVGSFVSRRLDNSLDAQETRTELLAMAGRLREAAKFIEKHAKPLNEEDWGMYVVPQLRLIKEEEEESPEIGSENSTEPEK